MGMGIGIEIGMRMGLGLRFNRHDPKHSSTDYATTAFSHKCRTVIDDY